MRILIVCSGNAHSFDFQKHQAFIYDQVVAVKKEDKAIQFDYFFINQKGAIGYLSCLKDLKNRIRQLHYNYIHAHFVTSALLANLQIRVPVIATFHGSDINLKLHRLLSFIVEVLSYRTIYVSENLRQKALFNFKKKSSIIPCGVDFNLFVPKSQNHSRHLLGLSQEKKYILFSSNFRNVVKNYPLAKSALEILNDSNIEIIELKNYNRKEVALLMTAVDMALMTSFTEGPPQFIKEALACNCPVISTDVGDVASVIAEIEGCYIINYNPKDVAEKIQLVLNHSKNIDARENIKHFDNRFIAKKLIALYKNTAYEPT